MAEKRLLPSTTAWIMSVSETNWVGVPYTVPILRVFDFNSQGYQPKRVVLEKEEKKNLVLENVATQPFVAAGLKCLSIDI